MLINNFNLNENDKIYALIIDYVNHDINSVTNNYDYKLFLENGTELNISSIKEDCYVNIYLPLEDFTLSNYDYYLYFSKQGYDIYDKKGNFYNDICSPAYLKENDITIPDRKKDIYPNNATICKDNCEYKGVIIEEKRIICKCNLNHNNNNKAKEEDNFLKEENNDNFFSYLLDKINYKIFKCYKLFIFDKMKKSYVFYATLFLLIIIALNIFIFYIFVIPKLRLLMYKQIPSLIKLKEDIIKEHNRQKNLYRDNIISKKKKKKGKKRKIIFRRINSIDKVFISSNSKIEMNSSSIQVKKLNDDINIKEDINELPFTQALKKDKRHFFDIFISIIKQKIELINLICGGQKIKILLIYQYILSLVIDFFFNTFLYSDDVVSNKYHNNGKLDIIVSLLLSITSNMVTSIICAYLNFAKGVEERLEQIFEIKIEFDFLCAIQKFFKIIKLRLFIFFIIEILFICFSFYYIHIFCIL